MLFLRSRYILVSFGLLLFSCKSSVDTVVLQSQVLETDTVFKAQKNEKSELRVFNIPNADASAGENTGPQVFKLNLGDQPLAIQPDAKNPEKLITEFAFASFINSQHTAALVQLQDNSGLVAPFYIISLDGEKAKAYSLYRGSEGPQDSRFTKGQSEIGRSGYLINNDFFVTRVDGRVYKLARQEPGQRIQGLHFMNSADRQTLVFLVNSALYQVHYPSGKNYTQPLPASAPKKPSGLFAWIQQNLVWERDKDQILWLKSSAADNRVRNLNEFKK